MGSGCVEVGRVADSEMEIRGLNPVIGNFIYHQLW